MHAFLEGLDVEAEIDLVCSYVLSHTGKVCSLYAVQEYEEGEDLVVSCPLMRVQPGIILHVLAQVYLLGYPEIVHGLSVPVGYPLILHVVEIIEVCGISSDHPAETHLRIPFGIEKRLVRELPRKLCCCHILSSYGLCFIFLIPCRSGGAALTLFNLQRF